MKQKKLQSKVCKDLLYFVHPAALIYTFKQSRHENIFASMTISESQKYLAEQSLQNHCSIPKISHFGDQNLKACFKECNNTEGTDLHPSAAESLYRILVQVQR